MKSQPSVLLLGDTVGTATTGLLYLASYLRRHGIEAWCQMNDTSDTLPLLRENIKNRLEQYQPQVVGISMKWFPHMARVLEMCKIIKENTPGTIVVIGGNTAAYYPRQIINNEFIDYVVLGDGEKPLLDICQGKDNLTNCIYKKDGNIINTPISYVHQSTNTTDIYLSHLEEILVAKQDISPGENFYINTGKGCSLQCFYCAGGIETQQHSFNRPGPFIRGIREVRQDLITVKKRAAGFMFDFDIPVYDRYDTFDYYKKIWQGIDLSRHGCEFYFWKIPPPEFIHYAVKTFAHAFLSIDMCSLSEPHRLKLAAMGLVKPQPTDKEVFTFFDICEQYDNASVQITPILGLPYFSEKDIKKGKAFITYLLDHYSPFSISWGRLHAQPGALLSTTAQQYDMHSYAAEYRDFLHYSQMNLDMPKYPDLHHINYPYIYFNDNNINMKISQYFFEINKKINQHRETRQNKLKNQPPIHADDTIADEGEFDL